MFGRGRTWLAMTKGRRPHHHHHHHACSAIKCEREEEEKDAERNTRQCTEATKEPAPGRCSSAEVYEIARERARIINERIRQQELMATT